MEETLKTKDPYAHYYALSNSDISRRLNKKRLPDWFRAKLTNQILLAKSEHIKANASAKRKEYLWKQLLDPAKYEWKMVNLMLTKTQQQMDSGYYANPDEGEARVLALAAYRACIGRWVLDAALEGKKLGDTPLSVAREATKRFPAGMPNDGKHWVDWVPDTVKKEISLLFDAIPHRARAKRKIPFERKLPPLSRVDHGEVLSVFEEQRLLLREKTERALEKVTKLAAVDPNTYADDLDRVQTALRYINEAQEGEILPTSWKGYFV